MSAKTMSAAALVELHERLAKLNTEPNWYLTCKKCGKVRSGTPEQLLNEECDCGN